MSERRKTVPGGVTRNERSEGVECGGESETAVNGEEYGTFCVHGMKRY